jgi:hypothetical protein
VLHPHRGEVLAERAARVLGEHALELARRRGDRARDVVEPEVRGPGGAASIASVASASSAPRRAGVDDALAVAADDRRDERAVVGLAGPARRARTGRRRA